MHAGLRATGLLVADWSANAVQSGCTVLDTDFGPALTFTEVASAWRNAASRPRLLHYVALLPAGTTSVDLGGFDSALAPGALTDLDDGFHRIVLQDSRISLTLCIGEPLAMLGELRLQADHVLAGPPFARWDKWWIKALARCCKRGTRLHLSGVGAPRTLLQDAGFEWLTQEASPEESAMYAPRWQLKASRQPAANPAPTVGRCAIVGAGLSGAAIAQAMALRGWLVDVYDQHLEAAQGASGLPAGLVVPHVSADDSPRSRLSRRGTRLMLSQAHALLAQGQDWQQSGVLELGARAVWHPRAGWIKPAQMVRAWLAQTGIQFKGSVRVAALQRAQGGWLLLGANAQALGQADLVVLANAHGVTELLSHGTVASSDSEVAIDAEMRAKLSALQQVHGTLSIGRESQPAGACKASTVPEEPADSAATPGLPQPPALPAFPVNGNGSFLPGVPGEHGPEWYAGATYETDPARILDVSAQHQANADKLLALLPHHAAPLMTEFAQGKVRHWSQTRCVTHDRMPLVGPVGAPGLWICVGMGSRGLSFAELCAQLLVAQIGAEPWPVEASLARSLHSTRTRRGKSAA